MRAVLFPRPQIAIPMRSGQRPDLHFVPPQNLLPMIVFLLFILEASRFRTALCQMAVPPETVIRYAVPARSSMTIRVYDVLGRLLRTLVSQSLKEGFHSVRWDGRDKNGNPLPSGVDLCFMSAWEEDKKFEKPVITDTLFAIFIESDQIGTTLMTDEGPLRREVRTKTQRTRRRQPEMLQSPSSFQTCFGISTLLASPGCTAWRQ